jgi:hypothetical protein
VTIGETRGKGIVAYDFTLTYDPDALTPDLSTPWDAGTLSEGWSIVVNTATPGQIQVSAFSTSALAGAGTLVNLNFKAIRTGTVDTKLSWPVFQLNEGEVPLALTERAPSGTPIPRFFDVRKPR